MKGVNNITPALEKSQMLTDEEMLTGDAQSWVVQGPPTVRKDTAIQLATSLPRAPCLSLSNLWNGRDSYSEKNKEGLRFKHCLNL